MAVIYEFDGGLGDILYVHEDRVTLEHKNILNMLAMKIKGDKIIYYYDLTAVQLKKAGSSNGYIHFLTSSEKESIDSLPTALSAENTIIYKYTDLNPGADKIVDYINKRMKDAKKSKTTMQVSSPADELLKYKQLADFGVITKEEFEQKKKELLGI